MIPGLRTSLIRHKFKFFVLPVIAALLLSGACAALPSKPAPAPAPEPTPPVNQPPVISSVTAEKEVPTLAQTQLTCYATDAGGNTLSYQWSADGGTISGQGSNIVWTAPETPGNYTVKVTASDANGGTATASTTIAVIYKPNNPPTITNVTVTREDGSQITTEPPIGLRQYTTVTLQCNAQDPDGDELSYLWSTTGGKLSGGQGVGTAHQLPGNPIGYTAPGTPGEFNVTVTVTDGRGGTAEMTIPFKTLCCGRTS